MYIGGIILSIENNFKSSLIGYRLPSIPPSTFGHVFAPGTSFPGERMNMGSESFWPRISFYNPGTVETVLPELAVGRVGSMRFATVLADSNVRAGSIIGGGRDRGNLFGVAFAACCKSTVVYFAVRALAYGAKNASRVAIVRVMTPRTTAGAVGHPNLHGLLPEVADHGPNIEGAINKGLHSGTGLGVPDIEVDCTGVCTPGITDNLGWGSKTNTVLEDRGGKNGFSIL